MKLKEKIEAFFSYFFQDNAPARAIGAAREALDILDRWDADIAQRARAEEKLHACREENARDAEDSKDSYHIVEKYEVEITQLDMNLAKYKEALRKCMEDIGLLFTKEKGNKAPLWQDAFTAPLLSPENEEMLRAFLSKFFPPSAEEEEKENRRAYSPFELAMWELEKEEFGPQELELRRFPLSDDDEEEDERFTFSDDEDFENFGLTEEEISVRNNGKVVPLDEPGENLPPEIKIRPFLKKLADAEITPSYKLRAAEPSTTAFYVPLLPAALFLSISILCIYSVLTQTFFLGLGENVFIGLGAISGLLSWGFTPWGFSGYYLKNSNKDIETELKSIRFLIAIPLLALFMVSLAVTKGVPAPTPILVFLTLLTIIAFSSSVIHRYKKEKDKSIEKAAPSAPEAEEKRSLLPPQLDEKDAAASSDRHHYRPVRSEQQAPPSPKTNDTPSKLHRFTEKYALPLLKALPIAALFFSGFLGIAALVNGFSGSLLNLPSSFFIISSISALLIGCAASYLQYKNNSPKHAGDIRNNFLFSQPAEKFPALESQWLSFHNPEMRHAAAAAEEKKEEEASPIQRAANEITIKKYFLERIASIAEAAKFYVRHEEGLDEASLKKHPKTAEINRTLEKLKYTIDALHTKEMTPEQARCNLQSFHAHLLSILGCTAEELTLAEGLMVWQDPRFEVKPVSRQMEMRGKDGSTILTILTDTPLESKLTPEQKIDFIRCIDPSSKERCIHIEGILRWIGKGEPEWSKTLSPFAKQVLKEMLPPSPPKKEESEAVWDARDASPDTWKQFQRWRPTTLELPGHGNAWEHIRTIEKIEADGTRTTLSEDTSYRQRVPSPLSMEDEEERRKHTKGNLRQMIDDLKQRHGPAAVIAADPKQAHRHFVNYWKWKKPLLPPCPVGFFGLLSDPQTTKFPFNVIQPAFGPDDNAAMSKYKTAAIETLKREQTDADKFLYKYLYPNIAINNQRDEDFDYNSIEEHREFIEYLEDPENPEKGFIPAVDEEGLSPEKKTEFKRIKALRLQLIKYADPSHHYEGRNRALHIAALYDLITQKMQGISTGNCKSSKDRKGSEIMYADAMDIYYACYGEEYTYDATDAEREKFVDIFCGVLVGGPQNAAAAFSSPGAHGIKGGTIFDADVVARLEELRVGKNINAIADLNKPGSLWYKQKKKILLAAAGLTAIFAPILIGIVIKMPFTMATLTALATLTAIPFLICCTLFLKDKKELKTHTLSAPVYFKPTESESTSAIAADMSMQAYFVSACIITLKDQPLFNQLYFGALWHFATAVSSFPQILQNAKNRGQENSEKIVIAVETTAALFLVASTIASLTDDEKFGGFSNGGFAFSMAASAARALKDTLDAQKACNMEWVLKNKLAQFKSLLKNKNPSTQEKLIQEKLEKEILALARNDVVGLDALMKDKEVWDAYFRDKMAEQPQPTQEERNSVEALRLKNEDKYRIHFTQFLGYLSAAVCFSLFAANLPLIKANGALIPFIFSAVVKAIQFLSQASELLSVDVAEERRVLLGDIGTLSINKKEEKQEEKQEDDAIDDATFEEMLHAVGIIDKKEIAKYEEEPEKYKEEIREYKEKITKYKIAYALRKKEIGEDKDEKAVERFLTHLHASPAQLNIAVDTFVCAMQNIAREDNFDEDNFDNEQDLAQRTIQRLLMEPTHYTSPLFDTTADRAKTVYIKRYKKERKQSKGRHHSSCFFGELNVKEDKTDALARVRKIEHSYREEINAYFATEQHSILLKMGGENLFPSQIAFLEEKRTKEAEEQKNNAPHNADQEPLDFRAQADEDKKELEIKYLHDKKEYHARFAQNEWRYAEKFFERFPHVQKLSRKDYARATPDDAPKLVCSFEKIDGVIYRIDRTKIHKEVGKTLKYFFTKQEDSNREPALESALLRFKTNAVLASSVEIREGRADQRDAQAKEKQADDNLSEEATIYQILGKAFRYASRISDSERLAELEFEEYNRKNYKYFKKVPGKNLQMLLTEDRDQLKVEDIYEIAYKITLELKEQFHTKHRILHRDIKPGNIMVDIKSKPIGVQLIDFDTSKQVKKTGLLFFTSSESVGTPGHTDRQGNYLGYQAPEIRRPDQGKKDYYEYKEATEIFALGRTFEEMANALPGGPNRDRENPLDRLIIKMTVANPEDRSKLTQVADTLLIEQEFRALSSKIRAVREKISLLEAEIPRPKDQVAADVLEARRQDRKQQEAGQAEDKKDEEDVCQGRFHPLLPTPAQATENPDLVYSDHLPEIIQYGKHKIAMWNILVPNLFSGFAPYHEEEKSSEKRAERLIGSISLMSLKQGITDFSLQEYWLDEAQTAQLKQELESKTGVPWYFMKSGPSSSCAHFSREKHVKVFSDAEIKALPSVTFAHKQGIGDSNSIQVIEFSDYAVVNMHFLHKDSPKEHAYFLETLLTELQEKIKKPTFVLGDGNVRVLNQARVEKKELGVTSVANAGFRVSRTQGVDYGHPALLQHLNGKMEQLASQVLNPYTGKVFVFRGKPPALTDIQQKELAEFRPALTLGTIYENKAVLGNFSILEYNQFLQHYFGKYISAEIAMNGLSEVGLVLMDVPDEVHTFLKSNLPLDTPFYPIQLLTTLRGEKQWTVPLEYTGVLHEQLMRAYVEVYKPKQDEEEASKAAPPQKKSVPGAFFKGNVQKPALLPTYDFKSTEIMPKALLAFQEALAARDAPQLDTLKKQIEDYAKEKQGSHFVHLYANLLLAEYLLIPHGKTPEQLESDTKLAQAHLTEVELSLKSSTFLSGQEQRVLHTQIEKLSHLDTQSAVVEVQLAANIEMLLLPPPEESAAATIQRK